MGIDWRTIRAMNKETYVNSGVSLGPTKGLSSPKNSRRGCLCANSNRYSLSCCEGEIIQQGIGNTMAVPGAPGSLIVSGESRGLVSSGVYLGPTRGLSSPKSNRRGCLCIYSNTYSTKCCDGALLNQGIGSISKINALGSFSSGFSSGFQILANT